MIRVVINLDSPDETLQSFGDGATIAVERSDAADGDFDPADTILIEEGVYQYELDDEDGDATSWYRWRVEAAIGSGEVEGDQETSAWSAPFQGGDPAAAPTSELYATLDELIATFRQQIPATDTKWRNRALDHLAAATQQIISMLGWDFFRHPAAGDETFMVEASGGARLCVHDGLIADSLTLVEIRNTIHSDWVALDEEDWELDAAEKPGHPIFHLHLTGIGTHSRYPRGRQLVRLTAARGWPAVPADARLATLHRTRQLIAWDPTMPGGPIGPEELGVPIGPNRMPDTMFRLRYDYSGWELGIAQCEL